MHELSIAVSLIERALEECEKRGGLQVDALHVRVGALSGVDRDALAFSYPIACQGTPLAGSRLVIEDVAVTLRCSNCGRNHSPQSPWQLYCPECRTPAQDVIAGREIELTALEVAE